MQRGLTAKVGVAAASWARFIFALPFALAFLAAVLAIDGGQAVQEVPYTSLRAQLLRDGQILELKK